MKKELFRGNFLDARTTAYALTDKAHTLESACKAFGVEQGKLKAAQHGQITEPYIEYNLRDVQATSELAMKLLEEFDRHPISLPVTKAYSGASIGKHYLRAMGIRPRLEIQPNFPKHLLGYAQSAFYGGRASAHIRRHAVPVVYTDFLSMYPTVNSLLGLWRFVIAREIKCFENCADEVRAMLARVTPARIFDPAFWTSLTGFARVVPNGDILPSRGKYNVFSNDWQIGLNHLYARENNREQCALWFSLPDVVASIILTGRIPNIIDAFLIQPEGILPGLKPTRLREEVLIDPATKDFFKVVVEQRHRLAFRDDLNDEEKGRSDKSLKLTGNGTAYGIFAEMNCEENTEKVSINCFGIDREPFSCWVAHPEVPGEYCFPPFASLITGAARLMLALLEHSVTALKGTYAMEDTDSMAIVATRSGGLIPCPGGPLRTHDGEPAIKALSWEQIRQLAGRFEPLKLYRKDLVRGSILKIEKVNFDPLSKEQRQINCLAISAKRYALFELDGAGEPAILQKGVNSDSDGWKQHGLGHLLNPTDPDSPNRDWTRQMWLKTVRESLGLPTSRLGFEDRPALGRMSVSSPAVLKALAGFNTGKRYPDQIKPGNFLLTAHVAPFGHPVGVDPQRFHLIAPYESDPRKWLECDWIDQYSGQRFRITTSGDHGTRKSARVNTYGDVLDDYKFHPESKYADSDGNVCGPDTIGLLQRRHVKIDRIVYIGKESNRLEQVESGTVHDAKSVYTEYPDPRRDLWTTKIFPELKQRSISALIKLTGFARGTVINLKTGRSRPHPDNERRLAALLGISDR